MKTLLCSAAALALLSSTALASTISTLADENDYIYAWGLPNTAAYGQTFTVSAATYLNNVTFRIDDFGTSISYDLYVYAWDATNHRTTGNALGVVAGSTGGVNSYQSVSTNTGGIALTAPGQYVAFLEATSNGSAGWGEVYPGTYAGGDLVFQNNYGDTSQVGIYNWYVGSSADMAFSMDFGAVAPVPLPATGLMLLGGLGGLAAMRRRRRRV